MYKKMTKTKSNKKILLLIFGITLTAFLFTSDAHRYTLDEDMAHQQTLRIVTQQPHPLYVEGESRILFEYPQIWPVLHGPICQNFVFCSATNIGHAITEIPFVFLNHQLNIINKDNFQITNSDFDDIPYVFWRNSLNPNTTFLELFYGPIFSALSATVFFLICRIFNFSIKISLTLTMLYSFTTMLWAYSNTSLNGVPVTTFILLGYLFLKKFQQNNSVFNLVLSATSLGFGFLVRPDAVLFIIPFLIYLAYVVKNQNSKIKKFLAFIIPTVSSYVITKMMNIINFGFIDTSNATPISAASPLITNITNSPMAIFGLLLGPGVGLFIFSPILLTVFFSYCDFYKRNKSDSLLFISIIAIFLIYYGSQTYWHGFNAWGARYLIPLMPLMLLPLGASLEQRKSKYIKVIILVLGSFGVLSNLVYVIQDVPWFVWCVPGCERGLYSIGWYGDSPLGINNLTLWTFEYSQLTHSVILAFTNLQVDIFLFKVLGSHFFIISLVLILSTLIYLLKRTVKSTTMEKSC
ncbi:MAG: glycosyltransferase family 39 protein [Nitrosarchaeum sp.]|nr:glycosyltransferase family 39 protein [Nitrosarchaeum sp.]